MMLKNSTGTIKQKGYSLLELLLSLTLFLIGVAAIYGVARVATIQRNTVNTRTDQLRSARIALEYIRRDALNAGYGYHRTGGNIPDNAGNGLFGLASDADTERDLLTAVVAGNQINTNALSFGVRTDVIGFISRDASFNSGTLIDYTAAGKTGTAVNITTATGAAANCNKYDLYLFESSSGTTQVVGMVTSRIDNNTIQLALGADDPFNLNQSATATGHAQSLLYTTSGGGTIKKINLVSYSITNAGVLVRNRFGNQTGKLATEQLETRELVYGVSDFQIRYFMEDGTTIDDPSSNNNGRSNQIKLNDIVQIQVSITLAPDPNDTQPRSNAPLIIREYISTKNLRYEAS